MDGHLLTSAHRLGSGMVNPNIKGPTRIWSWILKCKDLDLEGSRCSPHGVDSRAWEMQICQGNKAKNKELGLR